MKTLVVQAEAHLGKEIYRGWKLKEFLANMSDTVAYLVEIFVEHEEEHAAHLRA